MSDRSRSEFPGAAWCATMVAGLMVFAIGLLYDAIAHWHGESLFLGTAFFTAAGWIAIDGVRRHREESERGDDH